MSYDYSDELYHFGIKGMKWGVRRYQNKDGTLTAAGRKRYDKELEKLKQEKKILTNQKRTNAKLSKLDDMKKENQKLKDEVEGKTKSKTDDPETDASTKSNSSGRDLQEITNKMQTENAYLRAQKDRLELERDIRNLTPKNVSAGKKMASELYSKVVIPALARGAQGLTSIAINQIAGKVAANNTKHSIRTEKNSSSEKNSYSKEFADAYTKYANSRNNNASFKSPFSGSSKTRTTSSDTGIFDADFRVKSEERTYREQQEAGRDYISSLIGTRRRRLVG